MFEPPTIQSTAHTNGAHPAPSPASGGAFSSRPAAPPSPAQQTTFPEDHTTLNPRTLLYWLGWAQLGGQTLLRWLWYLGIILALVILLLPISFKYVLIGVIFAALLALTIARPIMARRAFLAFDAESSVDAAPAAPIVPEPLSPSAKIPVHVTGMLSVNQKDRFFLWLPGFYRTFATREHALLCQCRERRVLAVGSAPELDIGLWYAFWHAHQIIEMTPGIARTSGAGMPALRLIYRPVRKKRRLGGEPIDTLYIVCATAADRDRIWRDLHADQP